LPVANVAYSMASSGQPFVSGTADLQTTIAVGQTKTLRLPATLTYAQVLATVKNIKLGAVMPYDAKLDVSIDVPVAGRISVPLSKSGQIPIPNLPSIDVSAVHWQELSLSKATAVLDLKLGNTSQFDMTITQVAGGLTLSGTEVGQIASGTGPALKAGQEGSLQIPISISPENLGLSAFRMLSGSGSDYRLTGNLNIGTPFGAMQIPFDRTGKVSFSH
jgi:LEA14-like dessication related protein